jgi:shikimate 5-dehydrogenase
LNTHPIRCSTSPLIHNALRDDAQLNAVTTTRRTEVQWWWQSENTSFINFVQIYIFSAYKTNITSVIYSVLIFSATPANELKSHLIPNEVN